MLLDPQSTRRPQPQPQIQASLWVSGQYMAEGTLDQMNGLFDQECAAHSGTVEVRVPEGQRERVVRRRAPQR